MVTRPSSSASLAKSSSTLKVPWSSLERTLKLQPPFAVPSLPPGSSKTPSRVTNSDTTTFLMIYAPFVVRCPCLHHIPTKGPGLGHQRKLSGLFYASDLSGRLPDKAL